jgi:hypothetical protein
MPSNVIRRVAYLIALVLACAAFGFSLSGIAGTKGQLRPDGKAAELAKQHLQQVHEDCPWAEPEPDKAV